MRKPVFVIESTRERLSTPDVAVGFYTAPNFRLAVELGLERAEEVFVLSSKHGLLEPRDVVQPYRGLFSELGTGERLEVVKRAVRILTHEDFLGPWANELVFLGEAGTWLALEAAVTELAPKWTVSYPWRRMHPKQRWVWLRQQLGDETGSGAAPS